MIPKRAHTLKNHIKWINSERYELLNTLSSVMFIWFSLVHSFDACVFFLFVGIFPYRCILIELENYLLGCYCDLCLDSCSLCALNVPWENESITKNELHSQNKLTKKKRTHTHFIESSKEPNRKTNNNSSDSL